MFWLARLTRLERPWPPTPTRGDVERSLGAVEPAPEDVPRDDREPGGGRAPTSATNLRRDIARAHASLPVTARGSGCCGTRACLRGRPAAPMCPRLARPNFGQSLNLVAFDLRFPVGAPELVLDHLDAVQPVLDVRALGDDARRRSSRRPASGDRAATGRGRRRRRRRSGASCCRAASMSSSS